VKRREHRAYVARPVCSLGSTGQAIGAGLVDECHLFLCPIVIGGGKRTLPDDVRAQLELLDERRFKNGFVHLHYRVSA
jgi:dihydrofolate reductase